MIIRRRCPECLASLTPIGTCPYCHKKIEAKGDVVHYTYLGKYLHLSYILKKRGNEKPKKEYQLVKKKGFHKGDTTRILKINEELVNSFFSDYMNDYKLHDISVQVPIESEYNQLENAINGRGGRTIAVVTVNRRKPCKCGCRDIAVDDYHGETFCPICGLVLDTSIASEFLKVK